MFTLNRIFITQSLFLVNKSAILEDLHLIYVALKFFHPPISLANILAENVSITVTGYSVLVKPLLIRRINKVLAAGTPKRM